MTKSGNERWAEIQHEVKRLEEFMGQVAAQKNKSGELTYPFQRDGGILVMEKSVDCERENGNKPLAIRTVRLTYLPPMRSETKFASVTLVENISLENIGEPKIRWTETVENGISVFTVRGEESYVVAPDSEVKASRLVVDNGITKRWENGRDVATNLTLLGEAEEALGAMMNFTQLPQTRQKQG
jgi:hypothetical protein